MAVLSWDDVGSRFYETGVDHGVLYIPTNGVYDDGVAWNGLVAVNESPGGAESNPQYADNMKYLNLISAETFAATIEAFTYPDEFLPFDGLAVPTPGVAVGQQSRGVFGLSYRTKLGNDVDGDDHGYKLHLVYGCQASPSEKPYGTINESPEAITFSWEISTTPVSAPSLKPCSTITITSTQVQADELAALEQILYGDVGVDPRLPLPAEVITLFTGGVTVSGMPTAPTYNSTTDIITIPSVTGVQYLIDGEVVAAGAFGPITENTIVTAQPAPGYVFPAGADDDWLIVFS